jgi:hypothetical protein
MSNYHRAAPVHLNIVDRDIVPLHINNVGLKGFVLLTLRNGLLLCRKLSSLINYLVN